MRQRPTTWRYVPVALWDALAHALMSVRPVGCGEHLGPGALTQLFCAVAAERPALPQVETSIELIDQLRCVHITKGVTRWPVPLERLPGIFMDGLRVIDRLELGTEEQLAVLERQLPT